MQSLCLDVKVLTEDNREIEIKETSEMEDIPAIEDMVDVEIEGNQIEDEDTDEEVVIVEDEDDYREPEDEDGAFKEEEPDDEV